MNHLPQTVIVSTDATVTEKGQQLTVGPFSLATFTGEDALDTALAFIESLTIAEEPE